MNSRTRLTRVAPLVAAAMLLNFGHVTTAQRRRPARRAQATSRPAATPTPQPQTQPQNRSQTTTTQAQTTPAQAQATPTQAAGAQAQATNASAAAPDTQQRRGEPDTPVEELLSSNGFGVYVEVRRVGTLARTEELKTAVGALQLFGEESQPASDLFAFVSDNAEKLSEARAVMAFMPTRAGLP